RGVPAHVSVAVLAPGADGDGRQDGEQRRRLGRTLREPEREQRRHEEDPAADAEQAGDDARRESERGRCEVGAHVTRSLTAIATSALRKPAATPMTTSRTAVL